MNPSKPRSLPRSRPKSKSIPQHTDGREYVVCLKDGVDYDLFWTEMETTIGSPATVPDRAVRVADERPNMLKICHYFLTKEEADKLRADSRVASVDIPAKNKDHVKVISHASQVSDFSKPTNYTASTGALTNWGLIRSNSIPNVYGTQKEIDATYDYTLMGTGVDVVIVDTGIQADHPEFQDAEGNSRVQQIDWFDASGISPDYTQGNLNSEGSGTITSDSFVYLDPNNSNVRLNVGSYDFASENMSKQTENSDRALRLRFVGDSVWYDPGLNDINWEMRFLDNNWMEVTVLRHNGATQVFKEGIIQTSGTSDIVIKEIDTTHLHEGQILRINTSDYWYGWEGTVRHISGNDYAIDYVENNLNNYPITDLYEGLRIQNNVVLGGSIQGNALITSVIPVNFNQYTGDGSTNTFLVAERPINDNKITVLVNDIVLAPYANFQVTHVDNKTYVVLNTTPGEGDTVLVTIPPGITFKTDQACNEGPLRFNAYTANGADMIITSIDSETQITVDGYDGGYINRGYGYMFVGASSTPEWSLTNEYNDVLLDLSDMASPTLFGPDATPVSFVLAVDENGVWTKHGTIGSSYRAALVGGVWTLQAGLATTVGAELSNVMSNGWSDYVSSNFHTPFDFKSPFTGFVPELHYTDVAGHGTHVAGIVAGKTYGWAKDARIYAIKLKDLSGNGGLTVDQMFDVLIGWHNNKIGSRPTVVNMSWGYGNSYDLVEVTGGVYRGLTWTDNQPIPEYGMGLVGTWPIRDYATDVGIDELIRAGIHVCISSGNDGIKIDVPGGADYNNYFNFNANGEGYDFNYYQQGSSPYSKHAHMVGSLDMDVYDANHDRKAWYSNGGPGTSIYAPGTGIISSMSTTNELEADGYQDAPYHLDTDYKQANLSGTSMASPQIAGMIALWLQANPHATPATMKDWAMANVATTMWNYNSDGMDYTTENSPWGGNNWMAYNKFNSAYSLKIQNT